MTELKASETEAPLDLNFLVDKIVKLDKIKPGIYSVVFIDGSIREMKISQGDSVSLQAKIRSRQKKQLSEVSAKPVSEDTSAPLSDSSALNSSSTRYVEKVNRTPLEKLLLGQLDLEFKDPEMTGYWVTDEEMTQRLRWGYEHCYPRDVVDGEIMFATLRPGETGSNGSAIRHNELTLLKIRKEEAEKIQELFESKITRPDDEEQGGPQIDKNNFAGIKSKREIMSYGKR